jgi:3,4-dihydroxy 2-butanone 4-phosphate synthase/GTP cyclohydrolase II
MIKRRVKEPIILGSVEEALKDIAAGRPIIVADDPDRENEVDFIAAAQGISPKTVSTLIRYGSGVVCAAMAGRVCDRLDLPPMREKNEDYKQTAYTISCDADQSEGVTTGISAHDRAVTLNILADPNSRPTQLRRPGHILPLRAVPGGVFERGGHTEASVDLMRLAGLAPVAAIVEVMHDDGTMVRLHEVSDYLKKHDLPPYTVITIEALKEYRQSIGDTKPQPETEPKLARVGPAKLPTKYGDFSIYVWKQVQYEHVALVKGEVRGVKDVLVRVHSECLTGDALGSLRCDCGPQLEESMRRIDKAGQGVVIYLDGHEGRGIGVFNKIAAYGLQDKGMDTFEANIALGLVEDAREYSAAARILKNLGVSSIQLLTNNPEKVAALEDFGIAVTAVLPLVVGRNKYNVKYLQAKAKRGHIALLKEEVT